MSIQEMIRNEIFIPDAPLIPSLMFRGFQGESDYPKMVAVIEGSKDVDEIERVTTVEEVATAYEHLTNCDPYKDMLFAAVNGQVVGYNRCTWWEETEGNLIYLQFGFLLPEWRRKGIGRAMLRHAEDRLKEVASEHSIEKPRFFESFASDTEKGAEALLLSEGYEAIRHGFTMVRSLSESVKITPMPEGLEIRPVEDEHIRLIWEADQEAFQDHWGYAPPTEEDYEAWKKQSIFDPSIWKIAWDGDQVAGMVLNFLNKEENEEYNRKRGYTEGISVRRPWRRRGLARALLTRSLQMFKDMGMEEGALGVDTENLSGALRLYESVGFKPVKRHSTYRKQMA
jgi:ribosomal protein S18 acetylase RimI-like enzyme